MKRPVDVLLIEPDPRHAQIIRTALEKSRKPCAVEVVRDPEEARRFLETEEGAAGPLPSPFLILAELADPQEPPAAGLLRWLRTHERTRHRPVVVLAATGDPAAVRAAYDLGASSYLVAPSDEKQLGEMLDAAVKYWIELNHPAE